MKILLATYLESPPGLLEKMCVYFAAKLDF